MNKSVAFFDHSDVVHAICVSGRENFFANTNSISDLLNLLDVCIFYDEVMLDLTYIHADEFGLLSSTFVPIPKSVAEKVSHIFDQFPAEWFNPANEWKLWKKMLLHRQVTEGSRKAYLANLLGIPFWPSYQAVQDLFGHEYVIQEMPTKLHD